MVLGIQWKINRIRFPTRELGSTAYLIRNIEKHTYLFWNGGGAAPFINFYWDFNIDRDAKNTVDKKQRPTQTTTHATETTNFKYSGHSL